MRSMSSAEQGGEVELAIGGSVGLDAVDEHQGMVAFGAANANLREVAHAALAIDSDTRQAAQGIGRTAHLLAAQLLAGNDGDGIADGLDGNTEYGCVGASRRIAGRSAEKAGEPRWTAAPERAVSRVAPCTVIAGSAIGCWAEAELGRNCRVKAAAAARDGKIR